MTPIHHISEEDFYRKLDQPHNPPESNLSSVAFDAEYYRLYEELLRILLIYGENNAYGEGDYYLDPYISDSRGIGLEVTNSKIVNRQLIGELSDLVGCIDPRWEIYLRSANFDFGIFISATEAKIWTSKDSTFQLMQ